MPKPSKIQLAAIITFLLTALQTPATLQAAQVLFMPELVITEEYSDNIFLSTENEQEDFMTSAGLSLTLSILERNTGLVMNYSPRHTWFMDNSDLDHWQHAANLRAWHDIARSTRIELTNAYLETENPLGEDTFFTPEDPPADPLLEPDLYRRGRSRYRTNSSEARLSHQFGARDRAHVSMQYSFRKEIEAMSGQSEDDYTNIQPSFGLAYWFAQNWGTEIEGYYSKRDYENRNDRQEFTGFIRQLYAFTPNVSAFAEYRHTRLVFDGDVDDDYHIFYPSAGIRYQFEESAQIRIGAGYYIQKFDERNDKNEGWSINSEIYKRWLYRTGHIAVSGASGYGIADTSSEDLGLSIYYQGSLGGGYAFTPRFSVNAHVSYRQNEYPDEEPERTDSILEARLALSYRLLQWMNAGLDYRIRDFNSDERTTEYTENRVALTITVSPISPYRWN